MFSEAKLWWLKGIWAERLDPVRNERISSDLLKGEQDGISPYLPPSVTQNVQALGTGTDDN